MKQRRIAIQKAENILPTDNLHDLIIEIKDKITASHDSELIDCIEASKGNLDIYYVEDLKKWIVEDLNDIQFEGNTIREALIGYKTFITKETKI